MSQCRRLLTSVGLVAACGIPGSFARAQSREVQWSLSSTPIVSVGGGNDTRETLVRVVSVARLPSGSILLWEPRPAAVRLFGTNGRFVRFFAREGAGPGEVRDAAWIGFGGDTVFVFDRTQRRLTRFRSTGDVVSTIPFRPPGTDQSYSVVGRWRDGTLILRSLDPGFSGRGADGVRRDSIWIALSDSGGGNLRQVSRMPGVASFTKAPPGGGAYVARQPFGPEALTAVGADVVWVGDNSIPVVLGYDRSGQIRARLRPPFEAIPLDQGAANARKTRELELARNAATKALVNAKYAMLPQRTPYFSGIAVAPNGDLWVTEFASDDRAGARVAVMTPDGSVRASLHLPARFRVMQVDDSVVTGIYRDDDDVEFVRVYAIQR